tara:strand:- start:360 stop:599 length:240 start_codon:yes stop_codon:yes gene_type:complete
MKPSQKQLAKELQNLVTLIMKMIKEDYPDSTSVCSQNSMNLGEFKKIVNLTEKDIEIIKKNEPIAYQLMRLDLCERAVK